jgi:hypothetical protein
LDGHFAAVIEGKAVTVSPEMMLPAGVRVVSDGEGLPPLPDTRLVLLKGQQATQPLTDAFADIILDNVSVPGSARQSL